MNLEITLPPIRPSAWFQQQAADADARLGMGLVEHCPHLEANRLGRGYIAVWNKYAAACLDCLPSMSPAPIADDCCDECGAVTDELAWQGHPVRLHMLIAALCKACPASIVRGDVEVITD